MKTAEAKRSTRDSEDQALIDALENREWIPISRVERKGARISVRLSIAPSRSYSCDRFISPSLAGHNGIPNWRLDKKEYCNSSMLHVTPLENPTNFHLD